MEEEAEEMVPAAWAEGALPARAVAVAMVAMAVVAVVAAAMAVEARGVRAVRDIPLPRCAVRERAADRGQREVGGEGAGLPADLFTAAAVKRKCLGSVSVVSPGRPSAGPAAPPTRPPRPPSPTAARSPPAPEELRPSACERVADERRAAPHTAGPLGYSRLSLAAQLSVRPSVAASRSSGAPPPHGRPRTCGAPTGVKRRRSHRRPPHRTTRTRSAEYTDRGGRTVLCRVFRALCVKTRGCEYSAIQPTAAARSRARVLSSAAYDTRTRTPPLGLAPARADHSSDQG